MNLQRRRQRAEIKGHGLTDQHLLLLIGTGESTSSFYHHIHQIDHTVTSTIGTDVPVTRDHGHASALGDCRYVGLMADRPIIVKPLRQSKDDSKSYRRTPGYRDHSRYYIQSIRRIGADVSCQCELLARASSLSWLGFWNDALAGKPVLRPNGFGCK
jgi:hypothetical protein